MSRWVGCLSGLFICLGLGLLVFSCQSTRHEPEASRPADTTLRRNALTIGPPLGPGGQSGKEAEAAEIAEEERFAFPRSYPEDEVSQADRTAALAQLQTMRTLQNSVPYDPASDTCKGMCTEAQACFSGYCANPCLPNSDPNFPCAQGVAQQGPYGCFCVPSGNGGAPGTAASGCGWTPVGPTNIAGRVNGLAFDPGDNNRLIAATVGGVWISPDKGRTWHRAVMSAAATQVGTVAFNTTTRELFAGTGDPSRQTAGDGIWMASVDASGVAGESGTWAKMSDLDDATIFKIRVAPGANGNVYVATNKGLYVGIRSSDNTWSWGLLGGMDANIDDVVLDTTTSPPFVYAAAKAAGTIRAAGLWVYNTGANVWSPLNDGFTPASNPSIIRRLALAIGRPVPGGTHPALYVRVGVDGPPQIQLWRNSDGTTWKPISLTAADPSFPLTGGSPINNFNVLETTPNSSLYPDVLYSGGQQLSSSPAGGSETSFVWTQIADLNAHRDMHALTFDPTNRAILYLGTDGGVFRSGDTRNAGWTWADRSHGMQTAQFYRVAVQQGNATLAAGALQDNAFGITFGNRTWYNASFRQKCDGTEVAADAGNSSLLWADCQDAAMAIPQPVPYAGGYTAYPFLTAVVNPPTVAIAVPSFGIPARFTADPLITHTALARGVATSTIHSDGTVTPDPAKEFLLKTTDAVNWTALPSAAAPLTFPGKITAITISPSPSAAKYYYVGVQPPTGNALIFTSPDAGATWSPGVDSGTIWINGFAIDRDDPKTAWFVSRAGAISQTSTGGASWTALTPGGPSTTLPPSAAVTAIAAATVNGGTAGNLYVGTSVGVFQGALTGGHVNWFEFDSGLPNGIDVNDLLFNAPENELVIGTWGHGAFRFSLDLIAEEACRGVNLLVRNNVFDHGQSPPPDGVPDPEWPRPIDSKASPVFYKPDDVDKLYFWESTDIRAEVPFGTPSHDATAFNCPDDPGGRCPVDSVEFDSCPSEVGACPPWAVQNMDPRASATQATNFYVQVSNNGLATANSVRVITLITNAAAGVPDLPANFWSLFPPGGACPATPPNLGPWIQVGCKTVDQVGPFLPAVTQFPFAVPTTMDPHSCMVAIVDSQSDPIVLGSDRFQVEALALRDRHVAQRNLHILDSPGLTGANPGQIVSGSTASGVPFTGTTILRVPNKWSPSGSHQIVFSRDGMEPTGRLSFLLPVGKTAPGLPPSCGSAGNSGSNVAVSIPKGLVGTAFALAANGTVDVGDGAVLIGGGQVANAGSGQVGIGVGAKVGTISSVGNVLLRSNSQVSGDVNLSGTLTQQTGVVIQGVVHRGASLSPADTLAWAITWPSTSRGDRIVPVGQQAVEAPGRLGNVTVNGSASLKLSSGTYYVDSLTFESQSKLIVDQSAGPVTVYTRGGFTFRGAEQVVPTGPADLLVVALGSTALFVETSFTGSVVAPSASLTLGATGGSFVGSFMAHDLVVRSNVTIQQRASVALNALPACTALTPSEQNLVTSAGLSPVLYPVTTPTLKQTLPIPMGQTWTIGLRYESGVARTGTASRFRVMALDPQSVVRAGNTFLLRQ